MRVNLWIVFPGLSFPSTAACQTLSPILGRKAGMRPTVTFPRGKGWGSLPRRVTGGGPGSLPVG